MLRNAILLGLTVLVARAVASRQIGEGHPVGGETVQIAPSSQGVHPEQLQLEPIPGHGSGPNNVVAQTTIPGDIPITGRYGNLHAWMDDLRELVRELDDSEEMARQLRVKLVEKDNFLETMMKRERVLRIDLGLRKEQLSAMTAHIQAVEARVERLKKERQQAEVDYQKHATDSAHRMLSNTINNVESVSSALDSRIQRIDSAIKDSIMRETQAMRLSLQPDVAAGDARDEALPQAVAAAVANSPSINFLQSQASSGLRGAARRA